MFVEQNFVTEAKNKELPIAGIQQMAVKFNIPDLEKKKSPLPSIHLIPLSSKTVLTHSVVRQNGIY